MSTVTLSDVGTDRASAADELARSSAQPRASTRRRNLGSRLRRADLIVVTEAATIVCLWRVIVRWLRHRRRPRPRAPPGRERVSLEFLRFIVTWRRRHPDFL